MTAKTTWWVCVCVCVCVCVRACVCMCGFLCIGLYAVLCVSIFMLMFTLTVRLCENRCFQVLCCQKESQPITASLDSYLSPLQTFPQQHATKHMTMWFSITNTNYSSLWSLVWNYKKKQIYSGIHCTILQFTVERSRCGLRSLTIEFSVTSCPVKNWNHHSIIQYSINKMSAQKKVTVRCHDI